MGYRFDYLVARLPCGPDGELTPADASTEMTTRLRDDPQLAYLGVGAELPVDTARALTSGYLLLNEPATGEPVVLLHQWTCPATGYAYHWAEVVVTAGVITDIRAVDLNQTTLTRANYVVDDIRDVATDLAGARSPLALTDDQVVQVLREKLPADGGWRL